MTPSWTRLSTAHSAAADAVCVARPGADETAAHVADRDDREHDGRGEDDGQCDGLHGLIVRAASSSFPLSSGYGKLRRVAVLTRSQRAFGSEFARLTGLDYRLVGAQLLNEMNGSAAAQREANRDYNWLNIGWTDSGQRGTGNTVWRDPISAARASARWVAGEWEVPGFGRAAPGIIAWGRTAGKPLDAQIRALQTSGWASSGYPDLPQLVRDYSGKFGLTRKPGPGVSQGNGGVSAQLQGQRGPVYGRPRVNVEQGAPIDLSSLLQRPRPQVQTAGLIPGPGLVMPQGYRPVLTGGAPVREPSPLAQAIAAVGQIRAPEATVEMPRLAPGAEEPRRPGRGVQGGRQVPQRAAGQIERALQFAAGRLGTTETHGSNRSPLIDKWQQSFGMLAQPWCGIFVGKALQRAGVGGVDSRIASTRAIYDMAAAGDGPFVGLVGASRVRPGDVVVWDPGPSGHTGIVEQVNRDGTVTTIEGNTSQSVRRRVHPKSNAFFARPRYAA